MNLKPVLDFLLEHYSVVGIFVLPSPEHTVLPEHLEGVTLLNLIFTPPRPVTNLCIDEEGITCCMSFNQEPFDVVIRWPAVKGFRTDDFTVVVSESFDPQPQAPKRPKLGLVK